ncbi:MAG: hypothetical protein MZV70_21130 [Desulfobacterales bacterium]|nr:hypothetical protein [Desulfobacterales bacterium]
MFLFHPRQEYGPPPGTAPESATKVPSVQDVLVPVEKSIAVGARLHLSGRAHANILFFHGNGEIAADYDDIGPVLQPHRNQLPGRRLPRLRPLDRAAHRDGHDAGLPCDASRSSATGWRGTVSAAP